MPQVLSAQLESRLRRIQGTLGVHPDGILGPETLSALEARLNIEPPRIATSLECSISGLALIVRFEVSSKAHYEAMLHRPTWPGAQSGVTIGIGYDLGVTSKSQIDADWSGRVADVDLAALRATQGVTGPAAKTLAKGLSHVSIPFAVAEAVFYQVTLPRYAALSRKAFPGLQHFPADAQAMVLSLIYNRGTRMTGEKRTEMAALQPLIAAGVDNLHAIADQFESMTRLWPTLPGLQKRRLKEAAVIRDSKRSYSPEELVRI
jgi:hypothetical protein